ncbi:hypothetical protein TIFTF001_007992 [Ficus carica]|uniref:Uncharacterized protein n=1 Tax=Ficus carica TaxID=3494 RepID=A0AA88AEA2_FICCA|nr:hypothetical protein TIFTF001_007992 [Ficus carica]
MGNSSLELTISVPGFSSSPSLPSSETERGFGVAIEAEATPS